MEMNAAEVKWLKGWIAIQKADTQSMLYFEERNLLMLIFFYSEILMKKQTIMMVFPLPPDILFAHLGHSFLYLCQILQAYWNTFRDFY